MLYKQCITESIKSVFRIDLPEGGETMSEVRVKDKYGITSRSYESKVLPTYTIKDVVEEHLVPNIYIRRYLEELLKTPINPNRVS